METWRNMKTLIKCTFKSKRKIQPLVENLTRHDQTIEKANKCVRFSLMSNLWSGILLRALHPPPLSNPQQLNDRRCQY